MMLTTQETEKGPVFIGNLCHIWQVHKWHQVPDMAAFNKLGMRHDTHTHTHNVSLLPKSWRKGGGEQTSHQKEGRGESTDSSISAMSFQAFK